ncbi:MAG: tetratricopeptide repeat protein [Pseudomonadales bacterium]|nr:tetratricopeptide repeat protein [Pseudomonadales bacterium]
MSLVNDMLRDLDRRRDGPSRSGFGAERLVPVAEGHKAAQSRSLVSFVLAVVISLLLITGAFYFWQRSNVPPAPVQPAFAPAAVVAAPQQNATPQVDLAEMEEMARRMQELEEQNRALMEAQVVASAPSSAPAPSVQPAVSEANPPATALVNTPAPSPASPASDSVSAIAHVTAPAQVPQQAQESVQTIVEAPADSTTQVADTGGLIRSPRALSFTERDQLQVQDAMQHVSSGQTDQALRQLLGFVDANPNAHQSRELIIKLALQRGDNAAAQSMLDAGLALEPGRAGYRKLQARVLLGEGQAPQAVTLLSNRPPAIVEDIEYHDLLATAYLSSQDYESAARTYEALVQQNRSEARWWYGLASAWDALGRARDAALAYEQAMKLPSLSAALRQRSQQRIAEIGL